jgi:hypothetical protein
MPPISCTSVALAQRPPRRLATARNAQAAVVERLVVRACSQLVGLLADVGVLEQLHLRLDAVDRRDPALVLLELARLAQAQRAIYKALRHEL